MEQKHFECDDCGAVFVIKHDMDAEYYTVRSCPFCGEAMTEDENYDIEEDTE